MLDRATTHRLTTQVHHDEGPVRRPDLVRLRRRTSPRIEAALRRAAVELRHIGHQTALSVRTLRIDLAELHEGHLHNLASSERIDGTEQNAPGPTAYWNGRCLRALRS